MNLHLRKNNARPLVADAKRPTVKQLYRDIAFRQWQKWPIDRFQSHGRRQREGVREVVEERSRPKLSPHVQKSLIRALFSLHIAFLPFLHPRHHQDLLRLVHIWLSPPFCPIVTCIKSPTTKV